MVLEYAVITLGSFVASFISAAFATGGIFVLLAASSSVLPLTAAVPLQSAFAFSSLLSRAVLFRPHIRWPIVLAFASGAGIGVFIGANIFVHLDEASISLLLGLVLLTLTWLPPFSGRLPIKHPFFFVGAIHSCIGTLFGVGAILQPTILRTDLLKAQITGTLAACLIAMEVFKISGYVAIGFRYQDYTIHIILATIAGFVGSWFGKRITHRISEQLFRQVFRWLLTLMAIRMLYRGWTLMS